MCFATHHPAPSRHTTAIPLICKTRRGTLLTICLFIIIIYLVASLNSVEPESRRSLAAHAGSIPASAPGPNPTAARNPPSHHHHHRHGHTHGLHRQNEITPREPSSPAIFRTHNQAPSISSSAASTAPSLVSTASTTDTLLPAESNPTIADSYVNSMSSSLILEQEDSSNVAGGSDSRETIATADDDTEMTPLDALRRQQQELLGAGFVTPTPNGQDQLNNGDFGVWTGSLTAPTPTIEEQQRRMQQQQQQQPQQPAQNEQANQALNFEAVRNALREGAARNQEQDQNNQTRNINGQQTNNLQRDHHFSSPPRLFMNGKLVPREEDIIWSMEILAFVSKYAHLRGKLQSTHIIPAMSIHPEDYQTNDRVKIYGENSTDESEFDEMDVDDDPCSGSNQQRKQYESTHANYVDTDDDDDDMEDSINHWDYDAYDFESEQDIDEDFTGPTSNIFSLVELFTDRQFSQGVQYWAGVIMRNSCRRDDSKGGIRQCASFECGKWEEFPKQFAKCRRCKRTKYCSKACQLKAWNYHRHWCVPPNHSSRSSATSASTSSSLSHEPSQQQQQQAAGSHHHHHHHHDYHDGRHGAPATQTSPSRQGGMAQRVTHRVDPDADGEMFGLGFATQPQQTLLPLPVVDGNGPGGIMGGQPTITNPLNNPLGANLNPAAVGMLPAIGGPGMMGDPMVVMNAPGVLTPGMAAVMGNPTGVPTPGREPEIA